MKGKIKKFLFFVIAIMIIMQISILSFASNVTLEQTTNELIKYDMNLEKKVKENIEKESSLKNNISSELPINTYEASENDNVTWTDFSNATVSFEFKTNSMIAMTISNVKPIDKHSFYLYIGTDENTLYTQEKDARMSFTRINDEDKIEAYLDNQYMALNKEYYYKVEEIFYDSGANTKIVLSGKVERPALPDIGNRIDIFMYEKGQCSPYIYTYVDSAHYNNRKINYKIGKVADINLLKKFKTNKDEAFKDLLTYAKENSSITSGTIDISQEHNFNPIDNVKLDKNGYYFGYYTLDDENGKFYPLEDVQIYVETGGALCHFEYGNIKIPEETTDDPTKAPTDLPYTGVITVSGFIILSSIIVFFIYRKNKEYEDIK